MIPNTQKETCLGCAYASTSSQDSGCTGLGSIKGLSLCLKVMIVCCVVDRFSERREKDREMRFLSHRSWQSWVGQMKVTAMGMVGGACLCTSREFPKLHRVQDKTESDSLSASY